MRLNKNDECAWIEKERTEREKGKENRLTETLELNRGDREDEKRR